MATKKPDAALLKGLAEVPLFGECTKAQLRNIALSGKVLKKKAGATIIAEDSSGVAFFSILSGSVEISRGDQVLVRMLPGDFFGEMALLGAAARNASATAVSDVEVFALTEWTFKALLRNNAHIAYAVARAAAARAV